MDLREILREAISAGAKAGHETEESLKALAKKGNWADWDSCGFTWIRLKDRGLAQRIVELNMHNVDCSVIDGDPVLYLKAISDYFFCARSYDALRAAADVLKKHGIDAAVDCRAD
jgi:hypothetical protein